MKPVPAPIHRTHPNRTDAGQVEVMAGLGTTEEHIAAHLKITPEELREYYSKELKNGPLEANLQVAQTFHSMATSGDFPAVTIRWMEMRAGWSPNPTIVDTTADEAAARQKLLTLLNRGS